MKKTKLILSTLGGVVLLGAVAVGGFGLPGGAAAAQTVEVWKSPSCGCCEGWIDHMKAAGFSLKVHDVEDMAAIKQSKGVPEHLGSCHTAVVDGYVLEGHVPAADVRKLLAEKPKARGLTVPGMPQDAPGMDMKSGEPYEVMLFGGPGGAVSSFAKH